MALRRWLWLLAAIVILASAGFVALGVKPMPPDVPARVVVTQPPGDGGLRRPFPAMVNPAPSVKAIAGRGVDLLWDGSGADNIWSQPGASRFPPLLPGRSWPGVIQRAWARVVSYLAERAQ